MDAIARTAFGIEINSQEDLNHPFVKDASLLLSFVSSNPWYRVLLSKNTWILIHASKFVNQKSFLPFLISSFLRW